MLLSLMAAHEQERERADIQVERANQQQNRADYLQKKSDDLYIENLRLQVQVDRFKRWYYGPRADRLSTALELGQMLLAFGEEFDSKPVNKEDLPAGEKSDESPRRIRKSRGRRNLENFGKLPVQEHVYELSEAERACPCCGKQRKEIGADESWQLEYYPGHFERLHHVRKKYACASCDAEGENPHIESAVKPAAAIDKGLPGPGLLSYITVSKFDMYLPLYRLENHFERQGFRIARSTQSIWCGDVADLVEPVYQAHDQEGASVASDRDRRYAHADAGERIKDSNPRLHVGLHRRRGSSLQHLRLQHGSQSRRANQLPGRLQSGAFGRWLCRI